MKETIRKYNFQPASTSIPETMITKQSWWFVFNDNKLLVNKNKPKLIIPDKNDLSSIHVTPVRKQYLGTLNGQPCFSAEVAVDRFDDDNWSFEPFRSLVGLLDDEMFQIVGRAYQIMRWDQIHQYCGRCGSPTENAKNENAKKCPSCGLVSYPRISPAVIVAVTKSDHILLAKAVRFKRDFYSVLAGFVEPGESLEECIHREIEEEVGIKVKNITYFGSQPWPFPDSLMIGFIAEYASGELKIDTSEIDEARWFTAKNLPNLPDKISIARSLIDWFINTQK